MTFFEILDLPMLNVYAISLSFHYPSQQLLPFLLLKFIK